MALVLKDRVQETSTSTGTGTITLGGAVAGYQSFNASTPSGSIVYYCIASQAGSDWEVGYGTFTSPDQLSRTSVYSSSNASALVNFSAGTKNVFVTYPAEQAVFQQTNGLTEFNEGPISVVGANATAGTFTSTLAQFTSNEPDYSQMYIQNQNASANSSTDIAAYNNLGDGTYFFVDMGIASSAYNAAAYPIFQANDAYLYSYGNATTVSRLIIGTESPSANVVIFAGGVNVNNTALTISGANQNATFANSVTVTANLAANNATFTNFAYSLNSNTAAAANTSVLVTQAYVDAAVATGFVVHAPVNLATTTALTGTPTYNNGTAGVGATLTAAGVGTLSVDGQNAAANFRILVQSQANAAHNGAYLVSVEGDGSNAYVLTRTTDFNQAAAGEIANNAYFFVDGGDTLIGHSFVLSQLAAITVGTTALPFVEFASQLTYTGTAPINVSGQTISLTGIVPVANGGTNLSSYTAGDLLYANATNTIGKLGVGAQYQVLAMGASAPEWGAVNLSNSSAVSGSLGPTFGGTGQSTYVLGDIIYSNATNNLARLAGQITTTQKFLSQTGDGVNSAAPSWVQVASGDISGLGTMATQNANAVAITGGNVSVSTLSGDGSGISAINASNISSGTIENSRTTAASANGSSTIILRDSSGNFEANAGTFTSISGNGSALTAINASNISSGTVATARLATGTANTTTYLRGDQTWSTVTAVTTIDTTTTPPTVPAGGLWWDSDIGVDYIYYNDGVNTNWVNFSSGPALAFVFDGGPANVVSWDTISIINGGRAT
jgi:hypothetical protein